MFSPALAGAATPPPDPSLLVWDFLARSTVNGHYIKIHDFVGQGVVPTGLTPQDIGPPWSVGPPESDYGQCELPAGPQQLPGSNPPVHDIALQ